MLFVEHPISGGLGASLCDAAFTASVSRAGGKSGEFQTREIKVSERSLARLGKNKKPQTFYCAAWEGARKLLHYINN